MSDALQIIRDKSVFIDQMLTQLGGVGGGMGEKAKSLGDYIPEGVQRDLKQVTYLRNKVMHEGYEPDSAELQRFIGCADRAYAGLQRLRSANVGSSSETSSAGYTQPRPQTVTRSQGRRNVSQKSLGRALLLTLILGPFGMLYSTTAGGIVMLLAVILLGSPFLGIGFSFLIWPYRVHGIYLYVLAPAQVIWTIMAVNNYNRT